MNGARTLTLLSQVSELALADSAAAFHRSIESALAELVGFKLLTILRLRDPLLVRMHSSAPMTYPAGGSKDISQDRWLRSMLDDGVPVLSHDESQLRQRFFDHDAIVAMGCGSALNVPVRSALGTLGSVNLLHEAHWYRPEQASLVQLFTTPLALNWLAHDMRAARLSGPPPAG